MGVVGGIVSRYDLAGRGKERVYISVSGVMRSMFYGFGRGFGQVVKQGLSSLAQSEPFVERIKLERIRSGAWLRFAVGEIQS